MIIYRYESCEPIGDGPNWNGVIIHQSDDMHPNPLDDGISPYSLKRKWKDIRFGCPSLVIMNSWFSVYDLDALIDDGNYVLSTYKVEVPHWQLGYSGRQVVFDRAEAVLLKRIPVK